MSLNKNNILLFLSLFFVMTVKSQSVEKPKDSIKSQKLEEIIITATRTSRKIATVPMPIQIVSKLAIQQSNSIRLSDILNEQTGLVTVPDFGGGEGIQLQGLDAQYTLILIDGVPLIGRSAGTLDLNRITVGNIKKIEIVKGPASSLYGSEALGGVVNIITENTKFGTKAETSFRTASFGTHDFSASINHKKENLGMQFFVNRFSSNGYDLDESTELNTVNPFVNYTFDTKLTYDFSKKTKLLLASRFYTQTQDLFTNYEQGKSNIEEWNARLELKHQHNKNWESIVELYATRYFAHEFLTNNNDKSLSSESFFNQFFFRPEYRSTIRIKKNQLTFGLGTTHESLRRTSFTTFPEFNAPYVFGQYDFNRSEKLNVVVGARFDNHNRYKSQFNPKIAFHYQFNDKFSIKSSVGRGFKAPDFRQLYFDFSNTSQGYLVLGYNVVANKLPELIKNGFIGSNTNIEGILNDFKDDLRPESSIGINFGFDYKPHEKLSFSLNAFRNDVSNLINTTIIATGNVNVFSYENIAEVFTQGFEVNTSWQTNNNLQVSLGYQFLDAKSKDALNAFKNGEVFARLTTNSPSFQLTANDYFGLDNRSKHLTNLKIFFNIPSLKLNTNLRTVYRSQFGLFDTNGNNYIDRYDDLVDGYFITDFAVNKTFFNKYILGFGIDNVLDFTNPQNINNIPGRIFYGKINIQF